MLKVNIKSKIYKMKKTEFKALDNINFEINSPGLVCILGPSGSGKTTLMNIIGALDSDFDGDVLINGKSIKEFKNKDLDSYRKNSIGFIFQQFFLINKFNSYDNVKVALDLSNIKDSKKVISLLKKVTMDEFSKRRVNLLSGGQKQRVVIARALVNNPDIILADEPTGALDSKMNDEIMDLLKELSKTKLVLVITHSDEIVEKYATKVITMEDGKIINIEDKDKLPETKKEEDNFNDTRKTMSFFGAFKYSLKNILTRKSRFVATSIGMAIGIIGIGLALALSNGSMQMAKSQIESLMPTNMLMVTRDDATEIRPMRDIMTGDETKMFDFSDLEHMKSLNENLTHYWVVPTNVYNEFFSEVSIFKEHAETIETEPTSFYTSNGFEPFENVVGTLTLGRVPQNETEVVISLNTAEKLLDNDNNNIRSLIDKDLYIRFGPMRSYGKEDENNKIYTFKIVGITNINTMGFSMYQNSMDTLKLYESMYNMNKEDMKYYEVFMYLNKNLSIDQIKNITDELNNKQNKFVFSGASEAILSNVKLVLSVVRNVLIGFSSISVIVAILMIGIVIYISVIERISEIGILRAIGAKKKDIRNIFLSESVIIGLFAGIFGVSITYGICLVINITIVNILQTYGLNMGNVEIANLSSIAAISLIVLCMVLSAIAGIYPSVKASKLDPIVALRRS